jgi:hypothetical protein
LPEALEMIENTLRTELRRNKDGHA